MKNHVVIFTENNARILTNPSQDQIPPGAIVGAQIPPGIPPHFWKNTGAAHVAFMETQAEIDERVASIRTKGTVVKAVPDAVPPDPVKYTAPDYVAADPVLEEPIGPVLMSALDVPAESFMEEHGGTLAKVGAALGAAATAAYMYWG